jgi:DNA repair exonuclease SbcCD nuclease subunit
MDRLYSKNIFEDQIADSLPNRMNTESKIRFIHASDLHLGSHQYRSEERAKDFILALKQILDLAINHRVSFIILGGDVFTSLEILPVHLTEIVSILRDFKEKTKNSTPVIAIEGNHDIRKFSKGVRFSKRGQSWLKFIANLDLVILLDANIDQNPEEMFQLYNFETRKGGKVRIRNVMIYGIRYLGQTMGMEQFRRISSGIDPNDGLFHILIQHYGIKGQMKNVPGVNYLNLNPLKDRVNYLALGHYHLQFVIDRWVFNPGSSEAVSSVDHSFKRGIFLVEIQEDHSMKVASIGLKNRSFLFETVILEKSINKWETFKSFIIKQLKEKFERSAMQILKFPVLYLTLKGIKPPKMCKINLNELKTEILNNFSIIDVKIYQKYSSPEILLHNFLS